MSRDLHVVILAAGKGTRMKSDRPKVLHPVLGVPMVERVLQTARALAPESITMVIGHLANDLKSALSSQDDVNFVVQKPQLGTAHALLATESLLENCSGTLLLLSGDVPLLAAKTLKQLVDVHIVASAAATLVTAAINRPYGYGRIVRDGGKIARVVEEKDATPEERAIHEINAGIYAFALDRLFESVRSIGAANAQREYYLPDLVSIYRARGAGVETVTVSDATEILGINSRAELAAVTDIAKQTKNAELMASGVTLVDPATIYVESDVNIGSDTVIHPGVSIEKGSVIGAGCEIHSGVRIVASRLGNRVTVFNHCVISDSRLDDEASAGPFAHLRNGAHLAAGAKVGNFVEVKKSSIGAGSKSMHLTYLGDAQIGEKVNIGAGTITCNYDGVNKHMTRIEDGAFIGSDTQLIAPVTVGQNAYVGTGTTVRKDVPAGALAVSAGKQRNIEGWAQKKRRVKAPGPQHPEPST